MATNTGPLAITISLLGIAFVLHFSTAPCSFIGSAPTGLSTDSPGLILCVIAVLLAGVAAAKQG
ncbi:MULTISPECIES: hypothetical protein [unclassified Methanoculleus]|uniref:hypothetical protein n=1 Tax=unclassified Methanoculleus TaxID=2619537 RepID=UPI0025DC410D|nr:MULTISPECIES: hypothetical protein [unclassified Methanoculleus]